MGEIPSSGSDERQRVDFRVKGNLPRLAPVYYRSNVIVFWTLPIEQRATGWLSSDFHHRWQLVLLHACSRYDLLCASYVLMPDHVHLILLGVNARASDQRLAIAFLRKNVRPLLAPLDWQHQAYDHVLNEAERSRDAFINIVTYVLDNPVRANLVTRREMWAYAGCCVRGYPELNIHQQDYWPRFWRCYNFLVTKRA